MHSGSVPYILEDRTGVNTDSDFDDIYDRIFFRVALVPQRTSVMIYNMGKRASRQRDLQPYRFAPVAVLDFLPDASLGNVSFSQAAGTITIPMNRYLRKTSMFGRSCSRKFMGSDGREYKWNYRTVEGQEWSCTTADNFLVAHYDLKPSDVRAYGVSGHTLTIYEPFAHLLTEILASLTVMRHILQHNL